MNRLIKHRYVVGIVVILIIGLLLASCSTKPAPAPASTQTAAAKAVKMRYSGNLPPTSHVSSEQKRFAEEVAKRTGGQVTISVHVGGELYGAPETVDAVSSGAVEIGYTSSGEWSGRNPVLGFYNYFFLLTGIDHYERAKDGLARIFAPLLEKQNVKLLHFFTLGETCYCGNKPLVKPEDIKGMMVRGMNAETRASLQALGAVTASVAAAEMYDALAKKALDGTLTNFTSIRDRKLYEVTKYYSGPVSTAPWLAFMNLDKWKSLTPDIQKVIMEVGKEIEALGFKEGRRENSETLEFLKTKGTLTIFSPEQVAAWVKFVRPTYDKWIEKCEKAGYGNEAREVLKVVDAAR